MKILVTGASGFIGSRLVSRISSTSSCLGQLEIRCMTRNVESLIGQYDEQIKIIKADVSNYAELLNAMTGVDVAFYLIHSKALQKSGRNLRNVIELPQKILPRLHLNVR